MLFAILAVLALGLTIAMFGTRNRLLGFPSAIFWALLGGYAYTQSTVPWGDIYFYLFFASALGMVTFTAYGAYALREQKDTETDETEYIDEEAGEDEEVKPYFEAEKPTKRTQKLRDRANKRKRAETWG